MKGISLLGAGLLAAAGTASAQDVPSSVGRGQSAFQEHCTRCHPASKALRVAKGREGWSRTLDRMAGRYQRVFDEEILPDDKVAIVTFLVASAGSTREW